MTDRIKQLAEQAGLEMCGCGCDMPTRQSAKFAELILEECLKYIDDSFGDIDYVKFMIKRNFGVGK